MADHARCARCGRPLRSARSRQLGYGSHCVRQVKRAVKALVASGNPQAIKAAQLLAYATIQPVKRGRVWRMVSVSSREIYLVSANTCNCRGAIYHPTANSCYHSVAGAILAA